MKVPIDFTPYGHDWAKKMMKFNKLQLIGLLKDSLIKNELNDKNLQLLKSEIANIETSLAHVEVDCDSDAKLLLILRDKLRQLSQ